MGYIIVQYCSTISLISFPSVVVVVVVVVGGGGGGGGGGGVRTNL